MALMLSRIIRCNQLKKSQINLTSLTTNVRKYASKSDGDIPVPEIKPPGREWVDMGWKDEELGHGDYPNYKEFSYQQRDPNAKYFDQQERRHYGEPLHIDDDILGVWMPDDTSNNPVSPSQAVLHMGIAFGLIGLLVFWSEYIYDAQSRDPAVPKPYPYNNLYLELGGDPDKEPTPEDQTRRIPKAIHGW